jgi:hypothetical protein
MKQKRTGLTGSGKAIYRIKALHLSRIPESKIPVNPEKSC